MISELLKIIGGLQGELYFFLEDGPLKNKLIERYLKKADADADFLEFGFEGSVRIRRGEGSAVPVFEARLEGDDVQYRTLFLVGDFAAAEITELMQQVRSLGALHRKQESGPARTILRKKKAGGLLNLAAAANALGVTPRALKALIPCSDIRISERGGDKTVEEYYWEQQLISRFETLWVERKGGRGPSSEDLTFIAEHCCDGDRQWARDTIAGFVALKNKTPLAG